MEFPMLVLARKSRESVVIAANNDSDELVRVTVVDVCGGRVKLGFQADNAVAIHREEVWERVRAERQTVKPNGPVGKPKYGSPYID
jgi:carbon storage regulator